MALTQKNEQLYKGGRVYLVCADLNIICGGLCLLILNLFAWKSSICGFQIDPPNPLNACPSLALVEFFVDLLVFIAYYLSFFHECHFLHMHVH
jgi:hypothetical protein